MDSPSKVFVKASYIISGEDQSKICYGWVENIDWTQAQSGLGGNSKGKGRATSRTVKVSYPDPASDNVEVELVPVGELVVVTENEYQANVSSIATPSSLKRKAATLSGRASAAAAPTHTIKLARSSMKVTVDYDGSDDNDDDSEKKARSGLKRGPASGNQLLHSLKMATQAIEEEEAKPTKLPFVPVTVAPSVAWLESKGKGKITNDQINALTADGVLDSVSHLITLYKTAEQVQKVPL
jgi:hypothetical protein